MNTGGAGHAHYSKGDLTVLGVGRLRNEPRSIAELIKVVNDFVTVDAVAVVEHFRLLTEQRH